MTSLKYNQNAALLICSRALSLDCCADPTTYFDAMPCDGDVDYRKYCDDRDQCELINRKYVSFKARCKSEDNKVCECQRCTFTYFPYILEGQNSAATLQYTNGSTIGKVEFTDTNAIINDAVTVDYGTKTLSEFFSDFNLVCGPDFSISSDVLDTDHAASIIHPTSYFFLNETKSVLSRPSAFALQFGNYSTDLIAFDSDPVQLGTNVQNAIDAMGLSAGDTIEFNYNAIFNPAATDNKYYEIIYKDNLCGFEQPHFNVKNCYLNYTIYPGSPEAAVSGSYGEYGDGQVWGDSFSIIDYSIAGGPITDTLFGLNACPYEDNFIAGIGPSGFNNTQCCPQKGVTVGPNQYISPSAGPDIGYGYNPSTTRFSNLENTIILGTCHTIDPFWFIFGKAGRFSESPIGGRIGYVVSDCDWGATLTNNCDTASVCLPELFLTSFHQSCPWGPFGSYFYQIEQREHQANGDAASVSAWSARYGFQYAPLGYIKTLGTWQETKKIQITFRVKRGVPYFIGPDLNDLTLNAELDSSTVNGFDEGATEGSACGLTTLTFDCEDKTVGDFLDAVNAIKTKAIDGGESCFIFAFCAASNDARAVPASKVINVNSEMWDWAQQMFDATGEPFDPDFGGGHPELIQSDPNLWSGGDIIAAPKRFTRIWPYGGADITSVNTIADADVTPATIRRPPYCNHLYNKGPKQPFENGSYKSGLRRRSPLWTAMAGSSQSVLTIYKPDDLPSFISKIEVEVTGHLINVRSYSGVTETLLQSTGLNTDRSGHPYTVSNCVTDLNAIQFNIGAVYNPLIANSGSQPFTVWLDDSTYTVQSGPDVNFPTNSGNPLATGTLYNWSYKEPLEDKPVRNLFNGPVDLSCWVRYRCDYSPTQYPVLNSCLPPNATTYGPASKLDCDGDKVINTSYIVGYGCTGGKCSKETWYVKANRCECDDQYDCGTRSFKPHITNREGNDGTPGRGSSVQPAFSNPPGGEIKVSTPTLYICAQNIHPDCDIPMLVKVPLQFVGSKIDIVSRFGRGAECGASDIGIAYDASGWGDGAIVGAIDTRIKYEPQNNNAIAGGSNYIWSTQINGGFPIPYLYSEMQGWCQYIDPAAQILVQKKDIPRTWPPTAYVADQGYPAFCSINLYNEAAIYNAAPTAGYRGWDEIQGVFPHVPLEYLGSWGSTCSLPPVMWIDDDNMGESVLGGLKAVFRPIITNGSLLEIAPDQAIDGGQGDQRVDVNCATKCCGGVYVDCAGGFTRYPWTYTISGNWEQVTQSFVNCEYSNIDCNNTAPMCCTCRAGQGQCFGRPICGVQTFTQRITDASHSVVIPCSCIDSDITGTYTASCSQTPTCSNGESGGCSTLVMPNTCGDNVSIELNCSNFGITEAGNCTDFSGDICDIDECNICNSAVYETTVCESVTSEIGCDGYSITGSESHIYSPSNNCGVSPGVRGCTTTLTNTAESTITRTDTVYTSCPGYTNGKTWSYIEDWKSTIKWRCDVGNFMETTDLGDDRLGATCV